MKYRRTKLFWYDHGATVVWMAGILAALGFVALLLSVDCSTGGGCFLVGGGLADVVLPPR